MRKWFKSFVCSLIAVSALAGAFTACSKKTDDDTDASDTSASANLPQAFTEDCAGKIGNHVYYSKTVFENKFWSKEDKMTIAEFLNEVDASLNEDIYVTNVEKRVEEIGWKFFAYQYVDGAVIDNVSYSTDLEMNTPNIVIKNEAKPYTKSIDTAGIVEAETLFEKVNEIAADHADDLMGYDSIGVYGTYRLCYNERKDLLYYDFEINEYSHIFFDAKTGEVTDEYFY